MSNDLASSMACNLPGDIMIDILSRLSVKSLMKFKCVSKSWYALVTNPNFVIIHLNQSNLNHSHSLLFLRRRELILSTRVYFVSYNTYHAYANLDIPYAGAFETIGCFNGVLCLNTVDHKLFDTHYFLFNPATREFKPIQGYTTTMHKSKRSKFISIGFGYDPMSNDYKMVRIERVHLVTGQLYYICEVYTLSTNSWRMIDAGINGTIMDESSLAFVNSYLHWKGNKNNIELLITFDVVNEVFGYIALPDVPPKPSQICCALRVWKDQLALVYHYYDGDDIRFEMWVMEEYGVNESWNLKMVFGPSPGIMLLLGSGKNGELIFFNNNSMEVDLYDPVDQKTKKPSIHGLLGTLDAVNYMESLVTINGSYIEQFPIVAIGRRNGEEEKRENVYENGWDWEDYVFMLFWLVAILSCLYIFYLNFFNSTEMDWIQYS
ncbi:hypothetical protein LguiB_024820 [Lonicera macranthoides]